jgi:hypothetical protein
MEGDSLHPPGAGDSDKELRMNMKKRAYTIAGMIGFLLGMPLAEKAVADDGWGIAGSAIGLAAAITQAAVEGS